MPLHPTSLTSRPGRNWQTSFITLIAMLAAFTAQAAIFGVSQIGSAGSSFGTDTATLSYTLAAGTNRALIVTASHAQDADITGVTFNSQALTLVVKRNNGTSVDSIWARAMGTSASATTANIVVTRGGSTSGKEVIFAAGFQNVDQATPTSSPLSDTSANSGSTLNVGSKSGDLVFSLFNSFIPQLILSLTGGTPDGLPATINPVNTPGGGQTVLHTSVAGPLTANTFGDTGAWTTSTKLGASPTVATSWTSTGTSMIHVAANINVVPPLPTLSINDVTLNEGTVTDTTFTFTVSLSSPAGVGGVTFDLATADGTASNGNDYLPRQPNSVSIPQGSSTLTYDVTVKGDNKVEANETFFMNVTNVVGATVLDAQGLGTIVNDDSATADLSITKTDGVTSKIPGTAVTYTITVSNAGPGDATGAVVTDALPATITNASWTAVAAGGASGSTVSGTGIIADTVTIPNGGSYTYTISGTVSPPATGSLINTASVAAPPGTTDPNLFNNDATDTDTLTPQADLAISKTDGVTTIAAGATTTYTIAVSNSGPSSVTGATVTDSLPATIVGATWTAAGTGGATGPASGNGNISTSSVNLPVGSSYTFTVTAPVADTATGSLINTASVSSSVTDPDTNNNDATDTNTLLTPEIAVEQPVGTNIVDGGTKDFLSVNVGSNTSLTFTIKNTGAANLTGLAITKDGTDASMFTVTADPTAPVAGPSGTTTFTVRFAPTSMGTKTAALHIASNDANESPFDISITGMGVITHSTSQTITSSNSVSCNNAGVHTANSYWRAFDLPSFGVPVGYKLDVSTVQIGVETATATSGTQSITVRLYQAALGSFPAGAKTQIGTADFVVSNQSLSFLTIPVTGTIYGGKQLIVEVFTPDGQNTNIFFLGSNALTETGPSYISAPDCGVLSPTTTTAIGFPNTHWLINVLGAIVPVPEMVVQLPGSLDVADGGSVNFGPVIINDGSSNSISFTIRNIGYSDLTGLVITKDGTDATAFSITTSPTAPVTGPSGFTTFVVKFQPTTSGPKTAAIHIANNDADESPFDIALTGNGDSGLPVPVRTSTGGDITSGEQAGNEAGTGSIATWDTLRSGAVLAADGTIAFRANLLVGTGTPPVTNQDFQGIWKATAFATSLKARAGATAPGTPGVWDQLPVNPWLNPNGQMTFAGLLRISPGITSANDGGLWSELGDDTIKLLLREGDSVTGISGFVVDLMPQTTVASSTLGNAAFTVRLRPASGPTRSSALLRADVSGATIAISSVATQGGAAPAVGGGALGTFYILNGNYSDPRMDSTGNLAFAATLNVGGGVTGSNDTQGIWFQSYSSKPPGLAKTGITKKTGIVAGPTAGPLTAVARAGATAPGTGGAKFIAFERPTVADGGFVAFRGFIDNTGDNTSGTKSQGIWTTPDGSSALLTPLIRTGDTGISGMPLGSTIANVWTPFSSRSGKVAFRASLIVEGVEKRAIFTNNDGTLHMAYMVGDIAPDIASAFVNFDQPVIGDNDEMAFVASTSDGTYGIWKDTAGFSFGSALLLKVGDVITTAGGDRTIASISVPGSSTSDRSYEQDVIDNAGEMIIYVTYTDGSQGILISKSSGPL